jgi:hypothetical protein
MIRPAVRPSLLVLSLALAAGPVLATDKPAPPASDSKRDAGVIGFMADWQDDSGQWLDPMTFARIDPAKVKADDAKRRGKTSLPPAVSQGAPTAASGAKAAR